LPLKINTNSKQEGGNVAMTNSREQLRLHLVSGVGRVELGVLESRVGKNCD